MNGLGCIIIIIIVIIIDYCIFFAVFGKWHFMYLSKVTWKLYIMETFTCVCTFVICVMVSES